MTTSSSTIAFILLLLLIQCKIIICHPTRTKRSIVTGTSYGLIFSSRIGDDQWSRHLANPCRSSGSSDASSSDDVLGVQGREGEIAAFSSSTLGSIRELRGLLATSQCPDISLDILAALPDFSSEREISDDLLRSVYTSFHSLSAHFHFMRKDWREGRSCGPRPIGIVRKAER